jgi:hypothetical protein
MTMPESRMAAALALALAACAVDPPPKLQLPTLAERGRFDTEVFPILAASCAMPACHGTELRPLRIYALGRLRMEGAAGALTAAEMQANYDRALVWSMETASELPDMVRKPLDRAAGGSWHAGVDPYGRNIYLSRQDPHWLTLYNWIYGRQRTAPAELVGSGGDGR